MVADGEYAVYGANGIIGSYNKWNHEEPQLLVTCRGATCGAVNVSKPFSWINGNAMVIQPDLEKVSLKYMEYCFRGGINLTSAITGAAQPQITRKSLEPIKLSYPSLSEQQRIVAKLDAAFAEIDRAILLAEQSKKNALRFYSHTIDVLFEGYARDADTLGNLSTIDYGYTAKASHERGSYKFLRITDIQENSVNWDSVPFCEVEVKKLAKVLLQDGDIVFARTGATTGKSFLVEHPIDAVFASYLIRVSVDREKLIPRYVMHYFQSASYWEQVEEGISGAAQGGFNATKLSELKIPVVEKDIQQALITRLDDALEKSKQLAAIYTEKAQQLSELKSAILTQELQPPQSEAA
jgi:type I restriction enzyme S subunit